MSTGMSLTLDFEANVERITLCRLAGQYQEARRLLSNLSTMRPSSLSPLQQNVIAIEKAELLTNVGFSRRAETALRKAIQKSSYPLNAPYDLTGWSHAVLLAKISFVRLNTKGKFEEGLKTEAELRKSFLDDSTPVLSKLGLYVNLQSFLAD
jgi:hypothetical protein